MSWHGSGSLTRLRHCRLALVGVKKLTVANTNERHSDGMVLSPGKKKKEKKKKKKERERKRQQEVY